MESMSFKMSFQWRNFGRMTPCSVKPRNLHRHGWILEDTILFWWCSKVSLASLAGFKTSRDPIVGGRFEENECKNLKNPKLPLKPTVSSFF